MPKIDVYKGDGKLIPVDIAKKSKAFLCPFTKKIFSNKRNYVDHLKKRRQATINQIRVDRSRELLLKSFYNLSNFNDIINWIESHPSFFYFNANYGRLKDDVSREFWIEILGLNLRWSDRVSNSHTRPHNGVTNWSRNEKFKDGTPKPQHYSGWSGEIIYRMSHDIGFSSEIFSGTRINLCGGGGDPLIKSSYDVKFFDNDWPNLTKIVEEIRVEDAITDSHTKITFNYTKNRNIKNGTMGR